ncbi:hypothetical protein GCM10009654_68550 [Streptomyces hebeiensis]|uniref:Uncharacterized protein n=1 Tax=Streptomyces hebeiensis TaxID=229486 RepID=A0ABN1VDN0_9ACTN
MLRTTRNQPQQARQATRCFAELAFTPGECMLQAMGPGPIIATLILFAAVAAIGIGLRAWLRRR